MAVTKNLKQQLAAATAGLLATQADAEELYNNWNVDVGYLRYEEDARITVDTYMAKINGNLSEKDTISLGIVYDALTGATPSGALPPASDVVAVTGVSGGGASVAGGNGGLVNFDDTRLAIDSAWGHEWHRQVRSTLGAYISVEGDYTAKGGGLSLEYDTEDRAWTFTLAQGMSFDEVARTSEDVPLGLAEVGSVGSIVDSTFEKNTFDTMLGVSHIINRRTIAMLNYSYTFSDGYHTDPYKVISVADSEDSELTQVHEKRPAERTRHIIYSKLLHETKSGNHINLTYRYHTDDWDMTSHTLEYGYGFEAFAGHVIEPFVRLYTQEAANFYTRTLAYDPTTQNGFSEVVLPELASSDVRLAKMQTATLGMKYSFKTSDSGSIDLRLGYYHQQYEDAIFEENGSVILTLDLGKAFK